MVQPSNLREVADKFINYLGLNPNTKILLSQNYPGKYIICICVLKFKFIVL